MRKDKRNNCEPKGVYRVRNWSEYNAGLIARGSVTMWINESALTMVSEAETVMRGRPHVYSDALIQALLTLKQVYHLTLRAAQGFAQSLRELAFAELPVPNYTTLSRRAQDLKVALPVTPSGEPLHLVVDSTGVKLYGEGEWKVRKHGYSKRRTWRKVHLGLDAKTGQVRAALMTHQDVDDASVLPGLLDQIPADEPIETIGGDVRTIRSAAMQRLQRAAPRPRFHRAKGQSPGLSARPAQAGATRRSETSCETVDANGRSAAAITGVRSSRTRCTALRYLRVIVCGRAASARKRPRWRSASAS